jgi:uncharacterized delta-60 repeat protein
LYGLAADRVARLNANGSIDHTFQSLAFFGSLSVDRDIPRSLAVQPDGKIVVGLEIHSCGCAGASRLGILRLNADGSYDPSFDTSEILPARVNCLAALADGKILVGGFQFTELNPMSVPRHGIIRLNANGSVDRAFTTPLRIGSDVHDFAIEASGKIVLNSNYEVIRLNPNGSLDSTFKTATCDNAFEVGMSLAPDGNIYFFGAFDAVAGVQRPHIARIFGTPVPIPLTVDARADSLTLAWSNAAMHLQSSPSANGSYTDVLNARSPWKPAPSEQSLFFRLRGD